MKKRMLFLFLMAMTFLSASPFVQALPFIEGSDYYDADFASYLPFNVVDRSAQGTAFDSAIGGYTGDWSGYYLGTIEGNDNGDLLRLAVAYYLYGMPFTVEGLDVNSATVTEVETPSIYETYVEEGTALPDIQVDNLIVSYTDLKTGEWSLEGAGEVGISFYSVKAGNEFALYYIDPAATSGTWTTEHLENNGGQQPDISHLNAMQSTIPTTDPVPEPATMVLLGLGLVGFAGLGRKKSGKK